MSWLQLETTLGQHNPEILEPALEKLGAAAIWFRDAGDEPILEPAPGETPAWSMTIVSALFPGDTNIDELRAALSHLVDGSELQFDVVEDRDWQSEWQKTLQPRNYGKRLWVVPENQTFEQAGVQVKLSPGMAFGTGEHPTTSMCLQWLDGIDLQGKKLLDYGCGSGLLAIAGLALGASEACAVDIDPQALDATRSNAAKNHCSERLTVGFPEEIDADRQYDVVVANILSGALIELGPVISELAAPGAKLALSGILSDQAAQVQDAWAGVQEIP